MHFGLGSNKCEMGDCRCPHHKMVPFFIFLIGLIFLLKAVGYLSASVVSETWPVLLMLIGLLKMLGGVCRCCGRKD